MMAGMLRYLWADGGGPMHTASSASFTYLASRSASEYTTTDLTPSSRQARWIRRANSPRCAIRVFLNIEALSLDDEERPSELPGLAVLAPALGDPAALARLDLAPALRGRDHARPPP